MTKMAVAGAYRFSAIGTTSIVFNAAAIRKRLDCDMQTVYMTDRN